VLVDSLDLVEQPFGLPIHLPKIASQARLRHRLFPRHGRAKARSASSR